MEFGHFRCPPRGGREAVKTSRYTEEQVAYTLRLAESGRGRRFQVQGFTTPQRRRNIDGPFHGGQAPTPRGKGWPLVSSPGDESCPGCPGPSVLFLCCLFCSEVMSIVHVDCRKPTICLLTISGCSS